MSGCFGCGLATCTRQTLIGAVPVSQAADAANDAAKAMLDSAEICLLPLGF